MQLFLGIFISFSMFLPPLGAKNITFSLKNDYETAIVLHTGTNTTTIQAYTSYKFTKEVGTQIFLVEFGEKTRLLLTVKEDLEGKKLIFSDLMRKE